MSGPISAVGRRRFLQQAFGASVGVAVAPGWAAAARPHPIQRENARRGTTDWLLTSVQPAVGIDYDTVNQRRPAIEAYCSRASLRAGEILSVCVSTDPPSPFRVDVFRMGWYGGKGGRHVRAFGPFRGQVQPTPADGEKNVIACRWQESFRFKVPRDWVSGVYLAKLTAAESGYESYFIFIVRDDRRADFLFQCSDLTWQAYNRWPAWRSLYDWQGNKWHTKPGASVSFDRPYSLYYNGLPARFNPLTNGSGEFLLWEHPLCCWMEQQGYDVTYISNLDTHADPKGLLRAKGFLSVGHDEYWTEQMMDNVAAARDAGVNLAFLSGNAVDGHIVLKPAGDGRPDRVFHRWDGAADDDFPNEQELMGASSYGVGAADWICQRPDHWIFAGSGMKQGDGIPRLVGWEYHGPPLKADPTLLVLASGKVRVGGKESDEPPYAATIYTAARGNFVFNAGTCWWSMLLARPPGAVSPPNTDFSHADPRVQRMTRNLLERMRAT